MGVNIELFRIRIGLFLFKGKKMKTIILKTKDTPMNYIVNSASRIQQRKNVNKCLMKSSIIWICLSLLYSYLNCPPLTTVPLIPEKKTLYLIPATP